MGRYLLLTAVALSEASLVVGLYVARAPIIVVLVGPIALGVWVMWVVLGRRTAVPRGAAFAKSVAVAMISAWIGMMFALNRWGS